ncbi:AAA family ATPase [uncultured Delftia sp.]|uniref:AAA family ATPase n=1 Tax=uncultured Delftia sp. TaxID=191464 RepID=UPI002596EF77|nr:AAA family ATPase [uncultured Delftia sp.]
MKKPYLPAHVQLADYKQQKQARYSGNKLIEALPLPLSEEQVIESLEFLPKFDESSRQWARHDRLRELLSLSNVMVPLTSHVELALTLDNMLREGYIGRRPMSPEHVGIYQEIHDDAQKPRAFRQTYDTVAPKLSASIIGVSGMGKTTTIQRCLARYPQVIYHPDLDLYQITWLHFEMSKDGKGVKALLSAIIHAIAELIPDNTYVEDYLKKGRATDAALQTSVRILLNKHCVGLLVPDEIQNAANTRGQSDQVVMTELTTLANKSKNPVLYIGTPKAEKVLGLDMRQARRSLGMGLGNWSPLPRYDVVQGEATMQLVEADGEWVYFMECLWKYCWMSTPQRLTPELLDAFYDCTQGIIDLAIKLFIVVQARAILDDLDTLSVQLVLSVYESQFTLVHPMVTALRNDDREALLMFEDVKSLHVETLMEGLERRQRLTRMRAASSRPGSPDFQLRLVNAGTALGMPVEDAKVLAVEVEQDGTARNMFDAAAQLAKKAAPAKKGVTKHKGTRGTETAQVSIPSFPGIEHRPDDFRHAIVRAATERTSIVEQLFALQLVREPEDALWAA